jgi:hypothetical protein
VGETKIPSVRDGRDPRYHPDCPGLSGPLPGCIGPTRPGLLLFRLGSAFPRKTSSGRTGEFSLTRSANACGVPTASPRSLADGLLLRFDAG